MYIAYYVATLSVIIECAFSENAFGPFIGVYEVIL